MTNPLAKAIIDLVGKLERAEDEGAAALKRARTEADAALRALQESVREAMEKLTPDRVPPVGPGS